MIGNKHYQEVFARQMYNYKNVFDPSVGFMRGKGLDGKWQEPFDPLELGRTFSVRVTPGIIPGLYSICRRINRLVRKRPKIYDQNGFGIRPSQHY